MEEDRVSRQKQIETLVEKYYKEYDFLHQEPLAFLVSKTNQLFLDSNLTLEEIDQKLAESIEKRKKAIEGRYQPEAVEKNHTLIYSKLEQIIPLLNQEGIDYHLAGALGCYIKYGEESRRCHDDIDLHVNERDLGKLQTICEQVGLSFQDNRLHSPRVLKDGIPVGEHEVIANSPNEDFHIGVFCFERLVDGTIVSKGYYHDEEDRPCCREEIISSSLASEIYSKKQINFHGQSLSITAPEYIYLLKKYTNSEKDQQDITFLEEKIDADKVSRIRELEKTDRFVQCVRVEELPPMSILNTKAIENDNSELSQMLTESRDSVNLEESMEQEKPKELIKHNEDLSSEEGAANRYAIVATLLIIAVITLSALVIYNWIKL